MTTIRRFSSAEMPSDVFAALTNEAKNLDDYHLIYTFLAKVYRRVVETYRLGDWDKARYLGMADSAERRAKAEELPVDRTLWFTLYYCCDSIATLAAQACQDVTKAWRQ